MTAGGRGTGEAVAALEETRAGAANRGAGGYLSRQILLFEEMLRATREQQRYLMAANTQGLNESNRVLAELLERQERLRHEFLDRGHGSPSSWELEARAQPQLMAQVRRLAGELREASQTNYLLACRGVQFTDFSLSLLAGREAAGQDEPETHDRPAPARLVDTHR